LITYSHSHQTYSTLDGHYPLPVDALITLAKVIIKDVQVHHIALRASDAVNDANDDDTALDENDNLIDIYNTLIQVEPPPPPSSEDRDVTECERNWREDSALSRTKVAGAGICGEIEWVSHMALDSCANYHGCTTGYRGSSYSKKE